MSRKPDSEQLDLITSPVEIPPMAMAEFTEKAYLNYSMYVILDRALPSIADGLKPVQRRIIYAMSDLGLHATAKFKKSARTVGDVLGKFHPHGDTACYEAMVLMAQSFSYRYPLIDGQGNWGSQDDPKSFAAMRYTESRLTRYARLLLQELGQGTADWVPNFDGTLTEPKLLPARLPNVLLNGGSGIAVGMATDILPHNLREVADACVQLLDHPKTDLNALLEHIRGPDLPTEAEIVSTRQAMLEIYRTGIGSIRQRATWKMEGSNLILTALPYQVSGGKIQEQIAAQILSKKLPMIADLRDESDHEHPTRLVIEPRSRHIDSDMLMQHLFATTDLERSYRINLNMIDLNGRPRVFDLKSLLEQWLEYRLSTVTRRLEFRHRKVAERLHVLDGLLVAFLNIDEVIRIIRNEDKPKAVLINTYHLSDAQAEAILELKLRQLAKLEEIKIRQEQTELSAERKRLETLLKSPAKLKRLVRDEIMADAEEFGDDRRSPIVKREAAKVLDQHALIPAEPITVILSAQGWIRAAKGHDVEADKLAFKSGDQYLCSTQGKTSDLLLAIDSTGRTYSVPAHALPSARSFGEPLSGSFNPKPGATFCGLMMGQEQSEYLLFTDVGYGFVARLSDLNTRNKAGKAALTVPDNGHVLMPQKVNDFDDDWIAIITNMGRLLIFTVGELVQQAKGKGLKLIALASPKGQSTGEIVVGACVFREKEILRIYSGKRYMHLKPIDFDHYIGSRAQRGRVLPKGFRQPHLIRSIAK